MQHRLGSRLIRSVATLSRCLADWSRKSPVSREYLSKLQTVTRDLRWRRWLQCLEWCAVTQVPRNSCSSGTQYFTPGWFHARLRVNRLPVVKNPLSPIAPLHSIDSWPSTARPSRFMSFCNVSSPSCCPSSCSTRNATCRTSRGCKVGGCGSV